MDYGLQMVRNSPISQEWHSGECQSLVHAGRRCAYFGPYCKMMIPAELPRQITIRTSAHVFLLRVLGKAILSRRICRASFPFSVTNKIGENRDR